MGRVLELLHAGPGRLSLVCVLICTGLGLAVLEPWPGFDDANITMNYAQNIAGGEGYVYYAGGERVEGSTSPLWTAVAAGAALLPVSLEASLLALSLAQGWAIVFLSMTFARLLFGLAGLEPRRADGAVFWGFLLFPAFFGWVVWSLMDLGLWVLISTLALTGLARRLAGVAVADVWFPVLAILLVLTRPEGIVFAAGLALLLVLFADRGRWRAGLATLAATVLTWGALTGARLAYFGYPFPNTYYSKVSTDRLSTVVQGFEYLGSFLVNPLNLAMVGLFLAVPLLVRAWGAERALRTTWWAMALASAGGAGVYVLIGGDHFGSHRFFQFLYPVFLPFAALALAGRARVARRIAGVPGAAAVALLVLSWGYFVAEKGDYDHEWRIARDGREIGRRLSEYPGAPSLGVVPAGGISMTYGGVIHDLLGLNWVEMAHTGREKAAKFVNHGGFDRSVFFRTLPEIVHPELGTCDKDGYDNNWFFRMVLDDLFLDPEFQRQYRFECWNGLRFYRRAEA